MYRIVCAFKMFWFGMRHGDVLTESAFNALAKLLDAAMFVANHDRPYTTHMMLGGKRIVSFWMYPGMAKNPVDRISELLNEVDALKAQPQRESEGGA